MRPQRSIRSSRRGHTLIELVTASVSSAILLAGLGSVVLIASQVANTPIASTQRIEASEAANEFANDVRFATFIVARSPRMLDFVVADRTNDGTAERIRYEWSGVPGAPLLKTVNGGTAKQLIESLQDLQISLTTRSNVTAYTTTTESAETQLASFTSGSATGDLEISYPALDTGVFLSQRIDPTSFSGAPGGATGWNLTRVDFIGRRSNTANDTLHLQIRSSGDPSFRPATDVLGEALIFETNLPVSSGWYSATFSSPVRSLALHRAYDLVWAGHLYDVGGPARISYYDATNSNVRQVNESSDAGKSWRTSADRRIYYRLYGTYNSPGATYNVTRNFVTRANIVLQSGSVAHSRIESSTPLINAPELLSAYWRTDFDRDPTTDDVTRDGTLDWVTTSGGAFSGASGGIWNVSGAIESRPKSNFTAVTTIEARCRNTGTGGNGAVLRIQADRQGGTHAPLEVRMQRQADQTQWVSLYGKSNDATDVLLFQRKNLPSDFARLRLTILPANNVVNIAINDVDEGTYTYPTFAPTNDNRFLTAFADTSTAEFDYVEIRVAE